MDGRAVGGGGLGVGGTTHMRSQLLANLFTGCILFEVTGRKGDCTHAWAFPASALVTLEMAGRSPSKVLNSSLTVCLLSGILVGLERHLWNP